MKRPYTPGFKKPSVASDWGAWLREDLEGFLDAVGMAADSTTDEERSEIKTWARERFVEAIENLRGFERAIGVVDEEAFARGRRAGMAETLEELGGPKPPANVVEFAAARRSGEEQA